LNRINNQENAENVQSLKKQDRYHTMHQILTAMQSAKRDNNQVQLRTFKENLQANKIQLILLYKNGKIYGGYYQKQIANGAIVRIPAAVLGIDFTIKKLIERDESYYQAIIEECNSHQYWHEMRLILQKDLEAKDPHQRLTNDAVSKLAEFAFFLIFPFLQFDFKIEQNSTEQLLQLDIAEAKENIKHYSIKQKRFK